MCPTISYHVAAHCDASMEAAKSKYWQYLKTSDCPYFNSIVIIPLNCISKIPSTMCVPVDVSTSILLKFIT